MSGDRWDDTGKSKWRSPHPQDDMMCGLVQRLYCYHCYRCFTWLNSQMYHGWRRKDKSNISNSSRRILDAPCITMYYCVSAIVILFPDIQVFSPDLWTNPSLHSIWGDLLTSWNTSIMWGFTAGTAVNTLQPASAAGACRETERQLKVSWVTFRCPSLQPLHSSTPPTCVPLITHKGTCY